MKHTHLVSLLMAVSLTAQAEPATQVPSLPVGELSATYFEPAAVQDINADAEVTQVDTRLKFPIGTLGSIDQGLWVFQFNLFEREFRTTVTDEASGKQRLYDVSVPISYVRKLSDSSRYTVNVSPGVKSSLEYVGNDDWAANGVVQYSHSNDGFGYNLGIVYTHAFGEGRFVPLANAQWDIGQQFQAILGFPFSRVSYAPSKAQHYYLKLTPNGGNWHVYGDDKNNTFDYTQQGYRLGIGGEWRVVGPVWLNVEAGQQFAQELEFDNEQGLRETLELEDSSYLHLSARLRFR
ncbi:hypothetical protein CHH28_02780 [Bacterioplanes sanyensis]|uniref:DUF6268 domain-containing protein n=1 Tax=Bacterioplanes sanyensis TaxID=1249553 RepID=A0A222FFW5_9GAMM|nr:DUF6268 family outer membrane beta-barrel protein [Bacterioplanes sanyensis]ASP37660.1 hypothetical protein CHH28_02780 [Bacterioplanes sanyensis]